MSRTQIACTLTMALAVVAAYVLPAAASNPYFNGFETDNSGWDIFGGQYDATRVPSGTNGITSKTGSFHAEAAGPFDLDNDGGSAFSRWGAYSSVFGGGYTTSLDIYLKYGTTNDTRFDWISAINNSSGNHQRDFDFNGGYYNDTDGTGSGDRFVISAGTNAGRGSSFPKNAGSFTIVNEGWYTFQHKFYDVGGFLTVDLSILDSSSTLLHTWTISPGDPIATTGGNRYGWVASNEFSFLAIDNALLSVVPEPASISLAGVGMLGLVGYAVARRRKLTRG